MTLYLIRHLPTEWNLLGKLQGSVDIDILPVTEDDKRQIALNKLALTDLHFDAVLTSEYIRTKRTAEAYGFTNYITEPLLNELSFGQYEGKDKSVMLETEKFWHEDVWLCSGLQGELRELEGRIKAFLEKYQRVETVLAFAHGAVARAIMAYTSENSIAAMNQTTVGNNELVKIET